MRESRLAVSRTCSDTFSRTSSRLGHKNVIRTKTPFSCGLTHALLKQDTSQQDPRSPWKFLRTEFWSWWKGQLSGYDDLYERGTCG